MVGRSCVMYTVKSSDLSLTIVFPDALSAETGWERLVGTTRFWSHNKCSTILHCSRELPSGIDLFSLHL
jgi:hypothetical protein